MISKYILMPNYTRSKHDGDVHFISYGQLINLYQLDRKECINGEGLRQSELSRMANTHIILRVRYHGDYMEHRQSTEERLHG